MGSSNFLPKWESRSGTNFDNSCSVYLQKQPPGGVLRKRCSENMQRIFRRTPMPKCDFNKFVKQLYWNHTLTWVFSCKFVAYFQNTFSEDQIWAAASVLATERRYSCLSLFITWFPSPRNLRPSRIIYIKVNNRNTRSRC